MKFDIDLKEIMNRADLQHITHLILTNDKNINSDEIDALTYGERLQRNSFFLSERLREIYKDDKNEFEDAMCEFNTATQAYKEVFTEIGIKAGVRLLYQLLSKHD